MSTHNVFKLTSTYTNGTKQIFGVPRQGDESTLAKRLEEFRQEAQVVIRTKSKLYIIPFQNILRLEAEPFPTIYAKNMISDAVLIEETG